MTAITHPQNNFDFMRFAAATMVWYGHCYALAGQPPDPVMTLVPFSSMGVAIFFIISGYFITRSYEVHGRLLPFLRNRALRILPAMMAVILLSVCLLGPFVTSLGIHGYFASPETWRYLRSLLIFPLQYNLPGVFDGNKMSAVNGSLWTLQHEVRCYAAVAALGVLGILRPRLTLVIWVMLWIFRVYGTFANVDLVPHISFFGRWEWGKLEQAVQLEILFASGALLYLGRMHILLKKEFFVLACLLVAAGLWLQHNENTALSGKFLLDFALPYAVIYLGFLKLPFLHSFGRYGDFSYGMYLYAFPVQQLILHLWQHIGFAYFMAASFTLSLTCAIISWHIVEKPALELKK